MWTNMGCKSMVIKYFGVIILFQIHSSAWPLKLDDNQTILVLRCIQQILTKWLIFHKLIHWLAMQKQFLLWIKQHLLLITSNLIIQIFARNYFLFVHALPKEKDRFDKFPISEPSGLCVKTLNRLEVCLRYITNSTSK